MTGESMADDSVADGSTTAHIQTVLGSICSKRDFAPRRMDRATSRHRDGTGAEAMFILARGSRKQRRSSSSCHFYAIAR